MRPDWPLWLWALYGVGALHFALFVAYFFRFRALDRRAAGSGAPADVARYERSIRGFPAGFYAKMLGYGPRGPERTPEAPPS